MHSRFITLFSIAVLFVAFHSPALAQEPDSGEALWLRDSAISPDGSTIAFTYQGDIYTVSSTGGEARQITTWTGRDLRPVWSPDGSTLAFASDRYGNLDVFTVGATGGAPTRLTFDSRDDIPATFTRDGSAVLFESARLDAAASANFPTGRQPELYRVSADGGRVTQLLTVPAINARFDASGRWLIFEDLTSYENEWRKRHQSSAARDIWTWDSETGDFAMITSHPAEDRTPVFTPDGSGFYFTSEREGGFNVYKQSIGSAADPEPLTRFTEHPVRSLSISDTGRMAFSWDGQVWTLEDGGEPQRVPVFITRNQADRPIETVSVGGRVSEMVPSPNGKEVAFIFRGDVFVTSVESGVTKQVTQTVEPERWVEFHPEGRTLVYASERDGSWNLYESSIARASEKYFFTATSIVETTLLDTDADEYQPVMSPDGKHVAYLKDRMNLAVVERASNKAKVVMDSNNFFSYSDGDQYYAWSPDSKWLLMEYSQPDFWPTEVGLIKADGSGEVINMTDSGFADYRPKWMMRGSMVLWFSSRDGMRDLASTGSRQGDAYGLFLTQEAWDDFNLTKEEAALKTEAKKEADKEEKKDSTTVEPLEIDWRGLEDRSARLTIHSSALSDAVVTPDGATLVYLARFEKGYDLWKTDLRSKETSILAKMGGSGGSLTLSKDGKSVFMLAGGSMSKVEIASGKRSSISISGTYTVDTQAELAYSFGHAWRWINKKFYQNDFHGIDWPAYLEAYERFLPHISNGYDFEILLDEMLGELNVSHTGASFGRSIDNPDATAAFGLLFDQTYTGDGLPVLEVLARGPFDKDDTKVKVGVTLMAINGMSLTSEVNTASLLNHKAGTNVLLSFRSADGKDTFEEVVKAVSTGAESSVLYERWVESRRAAVDSLSGGRLGYIHVRSMSDASYRVTFEDALGKQATTEGMVVDTRWNGGGDLVDDLSTFLNGFRYATFTTREGRVIGGEPQRKWVKPSILLVNEGNYSDGHCFPYAYRTKKIGRIVGMPIAGTCSWVTGTGLPGGASIRSVHLSFDDLEGNPLENQQLEPDVRVRNEPEVQAAGQDQQLEVAVRELLSELDS